MRRPRTKNRLDLLVAASLLAAAFSASCSTIRASPEESGRLICELETAAGDCFHVIAHRGASAYAPENTLASLRKAVELGAVEVEVDVQLSKDDVVMLYHDKTLDQKTSLSGAVREHASSALRDTDIGSWFDETHPTVAERYAGTRIDRFEDVLEEFGDQLYYHVEIKSFEPELPRLLVDMLERRDLIRRVTITSFDFRQLERARSASPASPICWLLRSQLPINERNGDALISEQFDQIDQARKADFQMVAIRAMHLSREAIAYARDRQLGIRAFGIKTDADMEYAVAQGADGMTTDWPERLFARIRRAQTAK